MKVDVKNVTELLTQLDGIVHGMIETIREGCDDPIYVLMDLKQMYDDIVADFRSRLLVKIEPISKEVLAYLKQADNIEERNHVYMQMKERGMIPGPEYLPSESDNRIMVSARLYRFIKANLHKINLPEIKERHLHVEVENLIYDSSEFKMLIESKNYYYTCQSVVQDICKEIVEQRKKQPQSKLFDN